MDPDFFSHHRISHGTGEWRSIAAEFSLNVNQPKSKSHLLRTQFHVEMTGIIDAISVF
jgi:hypothetical protein